MLKGAAGLLAGLVLGTGPARGSAVLPQFSITQLRYRGGQWEPNAQYVEPIVEELGLRTSISAATERQVATILDPDLFFRPFLYLAGTGAFDPWSAQEREILRRYLTLGGFLLAEDTMGARGSGFDTAFRREMRQIFPTRELTRLSSDHPLFQSFYLINGVAGRLKINTFLEGLVINDWTPVIYCQNDLAGAWARDRSGKWLYECTPGGEVQRNGAFRLGINIIVYSLTGDYKKDLIHHPFIKKRQAS